MPQSAERPSGAHSLSLSSVAREVATIYRRHWLFLIPAAMVVLAPQALFDGLLGQLNVEGVGSARDVGILLAVPITTVVNLVGQALYAGVAAAVVLEWHEGLPRPTIRRLIRHLPIWGLAGLDLILSVGTAVGLLLLILPAFVFLTLFSLAPPVMKFERRGIRGSLRRSRQLVRGNFCRVFLLVVGITLLTEAFTQGVSSLLHGAGLVVIGDLLADGLVEPIWALTVVVVALRLLEARGEKPAPGALTPAVT